MRKNLLLFNLPMTLIKETVSKDTVQYKKIDCAEIHHMLPKEKGF
jgi:hypothetical protein